MDLTENLEPFVIFPAIFFTLFILVIIDRIGTVRTVEDEEEDI